jgi:ubiquinol-cytochrome c reductase cytochrome c1 subunit
MNKFLGLVLALGVNVSALAAGGGGTLFSVQTDLNDRSSLQDGARTFFNYCSGCHGLKYMRYSRIGEDLGLTEAQVMENLNFTGAKYTDHINVAMPAGDSELGTGGAGWFGKAPPDLSVVARARGTDWLYSYMRAFYPDPSRPLGWNNVQFPNAGMPHALWRMQGTQGAEFHPKEKNADGVDQPCHGPEVNNQCFVKFIPAEGGTLSAQEYNDEMRNLTAFLEYVGEPAALKREQLGVWVLLYLILLAGMTYWLKHEYWKDVH